VVLQFLNYKQPPLKPSGHHQALAGGLSISQLQTTAAETFRTPPGFSRWSFNFAATNNRPWTGNRSL